MEQQKVREIADQFIFQLHRIEQGNAAETEDMAGMFADDAQLSNPIIERDGSVRSGRDGVAQFWREYRNVFSEIHSEFTDITASDHSVGLFWQSKGADANGQPLEYEGVSLLTLDESGKISHFKAYFDSRQATSKTDHSLTRR
jgi:ketosteroid isomerase-like protein